MPSNTHPRGCLFSVEYPGKQRHDLGRIPRPVLSAGIIAVAKYSFTALNEGSGDQNIVKMTQIERTGWRLL